MDALPRKQSAATRPWNSRPKNGRAPRGAAAVAYSGWRRKLIPVRLKLNGVLEGIQAGRVKYSGRQQLSDGRPTSRAKNRSTKSSDKPSDLRTRSEISSPRSIIVRLR